MPGPTTTMKPGDQVDYGDVTVLCLEAARGRTKLKFYSQRDKPFTKVKGVSSMNHQQAGSQPHISGSRPHIADAAPCPSMSSRNPTEAA